MSMEKNLKEIIEELIQEVEQELDEATTTAGVDGYNTPFAFGADRKQDKKKEKETATQAGYTIAESVNEEQINEWKLQLDLGKVNPSEFENWASDSLQKKHKIKVSGSGRNWTIVGKGNDDRMGSSADWISQLLGKAWKVNKIKVVQKESVNEGKKRFKRQDGIGKAKYTISYHDGKKKHKDGSDFFDIKIFKNKKDLSDFVGTLVKQGYKVTNESVNESKVKRPVNRWLELKNDETMHPHKKMAMGLKELKYQLAETEKFFNWYNKIKTMNELDSQNYWKRTNSHIYTIKEKLIKIAKTIQEIEK